MANHTIIVGGGLSGLCLAHALIARGGTVTVFERDQGPDIRGQGYRLTIGETGSAALRACLPSRNYDFIRATAGIAGEQGAFVFLDEHARERSRFTFDLAAAERRGSITGQVDRATLRLALLSGLREHVRFGMRFTGYEERPNGVIAHFDDGSSAEGDMLVGADGANSHVRRRRLPEAEPRDTGIRGIFGRTPVRRADLTVLGRLLTNAGIMALGPRGRVFFCTAMRFRERPARVAERLGIEGNHWPSDDYFMWAVAVRQQDLASANEFDPTALVDTARHAVEGFHDDYQMLIRESDPAGTILVPIRVAPRPKSGAPRRVTLIGDAVHAMPPFGAHGANTAFKDAQTLASQWTDGKASAVEAIGSYESSMRRYSRPVVRDAMRMMTMATADFPFKQAVFRTVMQTAAVLSR
jgi:2-polyprenyl-6-methoxyphenol hydroxylase-like FAD-dependent oxidoreductase